ncbi:MAG: hypothetical protein JNJ48_04010 [Phycisphaerae bacterium]|nr:hypothetical protein [Phycisphaerae bacterium]
MLDSVRVGPQASTVSVRADWDDIDAALDVGLLAGECAVVSDDRPRRGVVAHAVTFTLRTIQGEPGTVTFRRQAEGPADPRGPEPITGEAVLGRYRDADRERRLLAAVARRLEALAGVDWAPIPGSPYAK